MIKRVDKGRITTVKDCKDPNLLSKLVKGVFRPLSTRLMKSNFHVSLSHRHSTTVSSETKNLFSPGTSWCPSHSRLKCKPLGISQLNDQGPVSRKSRYLLEPEKPFIKLRPTYSVNLVFLYVVRAIKIKITAKLRDSRRLPFEDAKRIISPEMVLKSFGTFEKQAPGAFFSKIPKLFGPISGSTIPLISSLLGLSRNRPQVYYRSLWQVRVRPLCFKECNQVPPKTQIREGLDISMLYRHRL